MNTEQQAELKQGYKVEVDDNFHFMDEDERWCLGEFATYEEAIAAAKKMVDDFFEDSKGTPAEESYEGFTMMGDDPFIVAFGGAPCPENHFSAWDYALEVANRVATERPNNPGEGKESAR